MYRRLVPSRREADAEACERAALSAAQAVDEVTKENLRRLEATMSWLQNEVRRLPRGAADRAGARRAGGSSAARLPATSAFDAVIDRSSLHRTVQGMHGAERGAAADLAAGERSADPAAAAAP